MTISIINMLCKCFRYWGASSNSWHARGEVHSARLVLTQRGATLDHTINIFAKTAERGNFEFKDRGGTVSRMFSKKWKKSLHVLYIERNLVDATSILYVQRVLLRHELDTLDLFNSILKCMLTSKTTSFRSDQEKAANDTKASRQRSMNFAIGRASILFLLHTCLQYSTDALSPLNCRPGRFSTGEKCQLCPPGTYQNFSSSTACQPCPRGSYNSYHGAPGLDVCIQCPAGTYLNSTGASSPSDCQKCPVGTSSPPGSYACISCPKNQQMALCPLDHTSLPGICVFFYSFNVVRSVAEPKLMCRPCFRGHRLMKDGYTCEECFSPLVLKHKTQTCVKCPPGLGYNGETSMCVKCSSYKFHDGVSGYCRRCPPGMIGNSLIGATNCVPCPRGTFWTKGRCEACMEGENSMARGATYCRPDNLPCAINFFRSSNGLCKRCSHLERYDKKKQLCAPCKRRQVSKGGLARKCLNCQQGALGSERGCECNIGWESQDVGKCRKCRPGSAKPEVGNEQCVECSTGFCAPKPGMAECIRCAHGSVQPKQGQAGCIRLKCGNNQYPTSRREVIPELGCNSNVTNCPPNTKRIHAFDTGLLIYCNVRSCPPGSLRKSANVDDFRLKGCFKCSLDRPKLDTEKKRCLGCKRQEINLGMGNNLKCKRCGTGFYSSGDRCVCGIGKHVVNGRCIECPAGTYGTIEGRCEECSAGTFVPESGRSECKNCKPETFSTARARECTACPFGTTTFGEGEANCVGPARALHTT